MPRSSTTTSSNAQHSPTSFSLSSEQGTKQLKQRSSDHEEDEEPLMMERVFSRFHVLMILLQEQQSEILLKENRSVRKRHTTNAFDILQRFLSLIRSFYVAATPLPRSFSFPGELKSI